MKSDGKTLTLRLENAGPSPIEIRRVAYRVPLRYSPGIVRRPGTALTAGSPFSDRVELEEDRKDPRYRAGDHFFAAQVDFELDGHSGRIYFTTHETGSLDDPSYPQQGFTVLGPIPRAEIDLETLNLESVFEKGWTNRMGKNSSSSRSIRRLPSPLSVGSHPRARSMGQPRPGAVHLPASQPCSLTG